MKKLWIFSLIVFMTFTQAAPDLYKVVYRKGDVSMTRSKESRKIFKGDFLIANDLITTSAKGLVILGYGENYRSRMKIGPSSELVLEGKVEDPEDNNEKKTNFFLKVGNILVDYINKDKDKNKLKVRTKTASMAIRGTEFFIHATPDGQTLVAVRSGVVLAKHNDKETGIPLTAEEGVVFTPDGSSGKLNPPKWYKDINWELNDYSKKMDFFLHGEGIEKVTLNEVISKVISIKAESYDKMQLQGEPKKWQQGCEKGDGPSCSRLALYLMRNGKINEIKPIVLALFNKACKAGEARGCVWLGRVEYEFGSKESGFAHVAKLCESKNAYACYTAWEIEKGRGNPGEADAFRKKAVSIMHDLPNLDETFSQFEEACQTEDPTACLNLGILSEEMDKASKAEELYMQACDLGSGAGCSNLGFLMQQQKKLKEANKFYTKACFLDESVGCYNLACLYSRDQKVDLSKQYLKMAISGGYNDWGHINQDSDLSFLRQSPGYDEFIQSLKGSKKPKAKK